MMRLPYVTRVAAACLLSLSAAEGLSGADWPAWRGPAGDGVSSEKHLPVKWSRSENVQWRVPLPERGNSTPIVSGARIFLTQPAGKQRLLMCLDRADGRLLWQRAVVAGADHEPTHGTNPYGSASPVTDGERVIVWFGSEGLHCYDFAGKKLWSRDLGPQRHIWGYGGSPVIWSDLCFLNFGPGERSFLLAVNKYTGATVWQQDEPSDYGKPAADKSGKPSTVTYVGSWSTPVLMGVGGREQLLMSWPGRLASYEPRSGKEIWTCRGLNPLVYTSPIHSGDTIVAMGGFGGMCFATRAGGQGDVTDANRLWHHRRSKQRIGSGVIHEGHIYIHNDPGIVECIELKTGNLVWEERLRGSGKSGTNWSSILLADGKCYTITQGGDCFVFAASPSFKQLAVNALEETSNSSLAASEGQLFIRTHSALWCIGRREGP